MEMVHPGGGVKCDNNGCQSLGSGFPWIGIQIIRRRMFGQVHWNEGERCQPPQPPPPFWGSPALPKE